MILTPQQAFAVLIQLQEPENPDAAGCKHWPENFRVSGVAVAGCELRRVDHQRTSYLDLWPGRSTQEQGFARACAASSVAG